MSESPAAISVRGARRVRGAGEDGFTLDVPAFDVYQGECVALTGPSGCGKSTLLEILGLVLRPDSADVLEMRTPDGEIVDAASLWERDDRRGLAALRSAALGFVFQNGGLLPFLSARNNIELSRSLLGMRSSDGVVDHLVASLGIAPLMNKMPRALSVGERQRVAIARALAHRPMLLLADEPTAALDPAQATRVMELLLELVQEFGMTAVVVTHDWSLVSSLGLREVRGETLQTSRGSSARFSS